MVHERFEQIGKQYFPGAGIVRFNAHLSGFFFIKCMIIL